MEEALVGRAAERLGLSQPAASNVLVRARALFGDSLLARSPLGGRRRTPRAAAMREKLRAALAELTAIVDAAPPPPAEQAPGIDLLFHPWHVGDEVARLERGEVDVVVAATAVSGASLRAEALGATPSALVMRRDHPAAANDAVDLDRWLAFPHVVVSVPHPPTQCDPAVTHLPRRRREITAADNASPCDQEIATLLI